MTDDRLRLIDGPDEAQAELVQKRLQPFTLGAQRYIDGELARRRSTPPLRFERQRWRAVSVAAAVVVVAAAAAWVLVPSPATPTAPETTPSQASHSEPPSGPTVQAVVPRTGPPAPAMDKRTLQTLDAQAQRLWRAGDLDGAARIFVRMTQHGGDQRYVELAYGDLVSLAQQRGRPEQIHALWREYLERFPGGRFSTDARAAVCGRSEAPSACSSESKTQ